MYIHGLLTSEYFAYLNCISLFGPDLQNILSEKSN